MDQNIPITTSQSVRYRDIVVQIETIILNDIECLCLEDVKQRFPTVTALYNENIQLGFLRDENGKRLEPLRIKVDKDKVIYALDPEGHSNDDIRACLDRMQNTDLILANTQETLVRMKQAMVQMYELHEYTTPRYFFILPLEDYKRGPINSVTKLFLLHYKLYFLCECSDDPKQLHIAPHEGYLIKKPTEFIATYESHIRTTLDIVRTVLAVGSIIIPQLDNASEFVTDSHIPPFNTLDSANVKNKLDSVEELLNQNENTITCTDTSGIVTAASPSAPLQGSRLRELESYLVVTDKKNSLGNLYRMITDDGHVRWVCLQHYDAIQFNNKMSEYIHQFEAFGGKFHEETKEAVITQNNLTTENMKMLCDLLTKGFNIFTLVLKKCSLNESDLDKLFDVIINRFSIRHLIFSDVEVRKRRGISKYVCENMSVDIKKKSVEIQLPDRCQDGDMKILVRLSLQNKICRIFSFSGCGEFPEYRERLLHSIQPKQESNALIVDHLNNIEFLNDILNRDSLLNQLKLNFWYSSSSTLSRFCETLGKNRTLVELDIMNHSYFDNEDFILKLLTTLRGHKSLKQLSLLISNLKPSDKNEACLIDLLLYKDSFISRLRLSECIISHQLTQALVQASQKLHTLTYLELYNYHMNDNDILRLQLLHKSGNLIHLALSNEPYWCVALKEMRQQFQKDFNQYKNLELEKLIQQHQTGSKIHLDGQTLTDRDMEIVINDAIINKQSKHLSLVENKITSVGALILADALNNNTILQALFINKNRLSDMGVYSLSKILITHNKTLEELDLSSNGITDEGIKYLVHMLKTNKTLTVLYLSENDITDEGVRILANTIQNDNKTIKTLWLSKNKLLTDSSVTSLIQMIEESSSLEKLFIFNCTLSDTSKKRLKKTQQSKDNFYLQV